MNLSRRSFLIGGAAVIAATQIPLVSAEVTEVTKVILPTDKLTFRSVVDVMMGFEGAVENKSTVISLRGRSGTMMYLMSTTGTLRWCAIPGNEFIIAGQSGLQVDVNPDPGCPMQMSLLSNVAPWGAPRRLVCETLKWDRGNLTLSPPLDLNASTADTPITPLTPEQEAEYERMVAEECDRWHDDYCGDDED